MEVATATEGMSGMGAAGDAMEELDEDARIGCGLCLAAGKLSRTFGMPLRPWNLACRFPPKYLNAIPAATGTT